MVWSFFVPCSEFWSSILFIPTPPWIMACSQVPLLCVVPSQWRAVPLCLLPRAGWSSLLITGATSLWPGYSKKKQYLKAVLIFSFSLSCVFFIERVL